MARNGELFEAALEWARPFVRGMVLRRPSQTPQEHAAAMMPADGAHPDEALQFELTVDGLLGHAERDPFAFDVLAACAAVCQRAGRPTPAALAAFTAEVLDGSRRRPRRHGPDPARSGSWETGVIVRFVHAKFGGERRGLNAARVVFEALRREGRHMLTYDGVKKARTRLGDKTRE